VDEIIVSDNYWPNNVNNISSTTAATNTPPSASNNSSFIDLSTTNTMQYHPLAQLHLDAYGETYSILKKPRKLRQIASFGSVELDLEFNHGVIRSFVVNPIQVSVALFKSSVY